MFEAARSQRIDAARTRQQQVGAAAAGAALQRARLQTAEKREGARDRARPARTESPGNALVCANRGTGLSAARPPIENGPCKMKGAPPTLTADLSSPTEREFQQRESGMPEYFSYTVYACVHNRNCKPGLSRSGHS